jgi:hypothetical protein
MTRKKLVVSLKVHYFAAQNKQMHLQCNIETHFFGFTLTLPRQGEAVGHASV